jgi:predicted MPP superfamily phosphohydrolase
MSPHVEPHARRFRTPSCGVTSRRRLLAGAGVLAGTIPVAGAVDGLIVTPNRLVKSDQEVPGRAAGNGTKLTAIQVSDLHLKRIGFLERRVLEQIHDSAADLILFTGDMVDSRAHLWTFEQFLRECPRQPRLFAIMGNWEHWAGIRLEALARLYERHGVELLVNRSVEFDKSGARIRVTGLDDLVAGRPDIAAALVDAAPTPNHLLLAHCPAARDGLELPAEHPVDLMLSGHTHGGQISPFGCALVRPQGSGRYVSGWYRDGGPPLYVCRGIGTSLVPIRIGATPELARFEWSLA